MMGEILTLSNKDSLTHARYWNGQFASKLYHEAYAKPWDCRERFFVKGESTPRCIMFHRDVVVRVEDFNKELLPSEPLRIKVDSSFPSIDFSRKSFISLPRDYFEPPLAQSDAFLLGIIDKVDVELEDRIRYFAEMCSTLEGFQFFSDYNNYYEKGFFLNLLDHFNDEYAKKAVLNLSVKSKLEKDQNDYYLKSADLYNLGKSLGHNNYACLPMGWGFESDWTAQDYSLESVCALGASINNICEQPPNAIAPFSIGFTPEYGDNSSEVLLDLFDFTASKQNSITGKGLVYGLRNNDGYAPHTFSFAFEPMDKVRFYIQELLKDEKPRFFSKNDLERDALENIHTFLDQ